MKDQNKQPFAALFGNGRTARVGAIASMVTLGLLAVCILLNALVGLLPASIANPNVTGSATFKLSGTTKDWLQTLDEDVTLYFVCDGGKSSADGQLYAFLKSYEEFSDRVTVEVIDSSSDATFINAYGGEWPSNMSVIVKSNRRYRIVDNASLYYYYNSLVEMNMTYDEYVEMVEYCNSYDSTGSYAAQFVEATTAYFDGDSRVTNTINFVTREQISVAYVLTGSGTSTLDARFENTLSQIGYDVRTTLTLSALPDDCDVLVINSPTADLETAEAEALAAYLANGGDLFLTTFYATGKLTNLDSVLASYGMGFEDEVNVVYENHSDYAFYDSSATYPYIFETHRAQHSASGDFVDSFVAYYAHNIVVAEEMPEGVTVTPWLYTSEAGRVMRYDETSQSFVADEEKSVCNVGVIAEQGETKIIWLSSPYALTDQVSNGYADGGNFELATTALNWMTGADGDALTIASAAMDTAYLSVSVAQFAVWGLILALFLPLAVAVTGIIIWYIRKKR